MCLTIKLFSVILGTTNETKPTNNETKPTTKPESKTTSGAESSSAIFGVVLAFAFSWYVL